MDCAFRALTPGCVTTPRSSRRQSSTLDGSDRPWLSPSREWGRGALETLERPAVEAQLGVCEASDRVTFVVRFDLHCDAVCSHCSHPRLSRLLRNQRSP
jgi:hypothetical protein